MKKDNPTKKEITIKIRDKEFKINFVSNFIFNQWTSMQKTLDYVAKKSDEWKKVIQDMENEKISVEDAESKIKVIQKEIGNSDHVLFFSKRMEIVQELCESNDIEFNKRWWERKTEPEDINSFIIQCIRKDTLKKT